VPSKYIFICGDLSSQPCGWTILFLNKWRMRGQWRVGILMMQLLLDTQAEAKHCFTSLNLHYRLKRNFLANTIPAGWTSFVKFLFPWLRGEYKWNDGEKFVFDIS
jgi:hypothetical protein